MSIVTSLDLLRGRVLRYRGKRSLGALAEEMGFGADVLHRFVNGRSVKTSQVERIEMWAEAQELARTETRTEKGQA